MKKPVPKEHRAMVACKACGRGKSIFRWITVVLALFASQVSTYADGIHYSTSGNTSIIGQPSDKFSGILNQDVGGLGPHESVQGWHILLGQIGIAPVAVGGQAPPNLTEVPIDVTMKFDNGLPSLEMIGKLTIHDMAVGGLTNYTSILSIVTTSPNLTANYPEPIKAMILHPEWTKIGLTDWDFGVNSLRVFVRVDPVPEAHTLSIYIAVLCGAMLKLAKKRAIPSIFQSHVGCHIR